MRLSWLLSICLLGCAQANTSPRLLPPAAKVIEWIKVTPDEAHKICRDMTSAVLVLGRINGCSKMSDGICKIYAPDFVGLDEKGRMEVLGHELKHCFDGGWHPANAIYR